MGGLRVDDPKIVVWWGTRVECSCAIARLERLGELDEPGGRRARMILESLTETWYEIEPTQGLRELACGLLRKHEITSADARQLAAALCTPWRGPKTIEFVCLDRRLARAAEREGLRIVGNWRAPCFSPAAMGTLVCP
jgi:predicted nucleic acid-binding protein